MSIEEWHRLRDFRFQRYFGPIFVNIMAEMMEKGCSVGKREALIYLYLITTIEKYKQRCYVICDPFCSRNHHAYLKGVYTKYEETKVVGFTAKKSHITKRRCFKIRTVN